MSLPVVTSDDNETYEDPLDLMDEIDELKKEKDATILAHFYVDGEIQDIADFVGDSLDLSRKAAATDADVIAFCGVRFMAETAKILSPEKTVILPDMEAGCSLEDSCPPDEFKAFCEEHSDRTVVVYANTSAQVKAMSDWVVTSSVALPIVESLDAKGEKILWAPDKHLGNYIQHQTGADMLLWSGACVVHEEFKSKALFDLKAVYPDAGEGLRTP